MATLYALQLARHRLQPDLVTVGADGAMADFARLLISASDDGFATIADTGFTNIVFAWVPPELRPLDLGSLSEADRSRLHRLAPRVKARMQSEGTALLGFQPVHGLNTFRLLVMNPTVGPHDVEAVLDHIARYSAEDWAQSA